MTTLMHHYGPALLFFAALMIAAGGFCRVYIAATRHTKDSDSYDRELAAEDRRFKAAFPDWISTKPKLIPHALVKEFVLNKSQTLRADWAETHLNRYPT